MKTTISAGSINVLQEALEEFKQSYRVESVGKVTEHKDYTPTYGERRFFTVVVSHRGKNYPSYPVCGKINRNGDECLRRIKHRGSHSINPDRETIEGGV